MVGLGLLLVFVGISIFLVNGFFVWPKPEKHTRLPFSLVCLGAVLLLLPALLPTGDPLSSISKVSFHGIFVFSAFLFYYWDYRLLSPNLFCMQEEQLAQLHGYLP